MSGAGLRVGLGKSDITPPVGTELSGYGPYLGRRSTRVRESLWAKAIAWEHAGQRACLVSCDLLGTARGVVETVRRLVQDATGLAGSALMVASTHTHSGPATADLMGWGEPDATYVEALPQRIAAACVAAMADLAPASLRYSAQPCEGIGRNREYDATLPTLEQAFDDAWRPLRPELTDTTCHVLTVHRDGTLRAVLSSFGCHPVIGSEQTTDIHGDWCGVANSRIEADTGATVCFLQGAHGDINPCIAHQSPDVTARALDIVAARYARVLARGIAAARPIPTDPLAIAQRFHPFRRRVPDPSQLEQSIARRRATIAASANAAGHATRYESVCLAAERRILARMTAGEDLCGPVELQGLRIGPLTILASPFETFQAIRQEVVARAAGPFTIVASVVNDSVGYAPDRVVAARGGYAQDLVPLLYGMLPYAAAHDDLVEGLLALDAALARAEALA